MEQESKGLFRRRRTEQQIRNLLAEFNTAGMTIKEFCRSHQVSTGTFHKWQSRHKSSPVHQSGSPGFVEMLVGGSPSGALFAEVNGIRIYQPVMASYLKELLP